MGKLRRLDPATGISEYYDVDASWLQEFEGLGYTLLPGVCA